MNDSNEEAYQENVVRPELEREREEEEEKLIANSD